MKVEEIMTTDAKFAEVPGTRAELLDLMNKHKVDGLPVVKKGTRKIIGMITKTDLLKKPSENQIAMLMSRDPIAVPPDMPVADAVRVLVDNRIRRLPVIDKNTCVGLVTVADIVWKAITIVKDYPICVSLDCPIYTGVYLSALRITPMSSFHLNSLIKIPDKSIVILINN